jgi:hypothetical protein
MPSAPSDLNSNRTPNAAAGEQRFFAVPVAALAGLGELACDIYIQHPMSSRKLLYRGANSNLPIGDEGKLRRQNIDVLYLRAEDRDRFDAAVLNSLASQASIPRCGWR